MDEIEQGVGGIGENDIFQKKNFAILQVLFYLAL
jgi:hypothetical protein